MKKVFKTFVRRIRDLATDERTKARAKLAEDAMFAKAGLAVSSSIAKEIANLTEKFCKNSSPGFVDGGVFIFAKYPDIDGVFHIYAKQLTTDERIRINENPRLSEDPRALIESLNMRRIEITPTDPDLNQITDE